MRWNMGQEFTLIVLLKTANTKPPSCPLVLWLNLLTPTRSPMIDPVSYIYIYTYSHGYHQPYKSYLVVIYGYRLPKHIYIYIHQHYISRH